MWRSFSFPLVVCMRFMPPSNCTMRPMAFVEKKNLSHINTCACEEFAVFYCKKLVKKRNFVRLYAIVQ